MKALRRLNRRLARTFVIELKTFLPSTAHDPGGLGLSSRIFCASICETAAEFMLFTTLS